MEPTNYDMQKSTLQFESPKYQSSFIKVIGVGGGGTNAVNHMYDKGIQGVDFIICNTDDKSLDSSPVPTKIKLGKSGLGAGNIPSVARDRAAEVGEEIKELLSNNTQMLFITAGMGGGTGTGAAPVIAQLAKEIEIDDDVNRILVVAIVTLPFGFEGRRRRIQAEEGIKELRKYVDAILIINNDKLRDFGKMGLREAFSKADDILLTAAKGIAEIITVKSYINIDFRDVNTVMQSSGVALMGSGCAEGENRAIKAIEMATSSALLNDNNIKGAKNILLYLASGTEEIDMDEIGEITDYIHQEADREVDVIWGAGFDESLGNRLSITLIATGFDTKEFEPTPIRPRTVLEATPEIPVKVPVKANHILEVEKEREDIKITRDIVTEVSSSVAESNELEFIVKKSETTTILQEQTLKQQEEEVVAESQSDVNEVKELFPDNNEPFIKQTITVKEEKEEIPLPYLAQKAVSHEEFVRERARRMNEVSIKLQTPKGLEELEKIPAYQMFGLDIKEPEHSSKSEISNMTINDKSELKEGGNSFIYDQPD